MKRDDSRLLIRGYDDLTRSGRVEALENLTNLEPDTAKPTVFYGFDQAYAPYCAVSLYSLLQNASRLDFNVILFGFSLLEENRACFREVCRQFHTTVLLLELSEDVVMGFPQSLHLSRATWCSVLLPEMLNSDFAVFVDSDTLVTGDINDLLAQCRHIHNLGVVKENDDKSNQRRLGMKEESDYFNAGVILYNIRHWNQNAVGEKARSFCKDRDDLRFLDQDLLNLVFEGRVEFINGDWNRRRVGTDTPYDLNQLENHVGILHFNGPVKPWMAWSKKREREIYKIYADKINLREEHYIQQPRNINQAEKLFVVLQEEGRFQEATRIRQAILRSRAATGK